MNTEPPRGVQTQRSAVPSVGNVVSFGEDGAGELYVMASSGIIDQIVRKQ